MRLKMTDRPLSVTNNGNNIVNSPKRINTLHNSNIITNYSLQDNTTTTKTTNNTTRTNEETTTTTTTTTDEVLVLNNINNSQTRDKDVQWCSIVQNNQKEQQQQEQQQQQQKNNNRNCLLNINNTLATSLRNKRPPTASSICSTESSPDDSLLDFEDGSLIRNASSADASPQDEDRDFDVADAAAVSDTETSSEELNVTNGRAPCTRRGIINPNYPGFQHLAHTLDYDIKLSTSDTEDDLDYYYNLETETNNNYPLLDKIDSVNRLDSVENIQKVFHEKNINDLNYSKDIIGDFEGEIERELETISSSYELERATVRELEDAVEKLSSSLDFEPSATKYNIEPNVHEPFSKLSPTEQPTVLNDAVTQKTTERREPIETVTTETLERREPIETVTTKTLERREPIGVVTTKTLERHEPIGVVTTETLERREPIGAVTTKTLERLEGTEGAVAEAKTVERLDEIETDLATGSVSFHVVKNKMEDAFLSTGREVIEETKMDVDKVRRDSNREIEEIEKQIKKIKSDTKLSPSKLEEIEKLFCKEEITKSYKEKDVDSSLNNNRKGCKKQRGAVYQQYNGVPIQRRDLSSRNRDVSNRRSVPMVKDKKFGSESLGKIDVYNIETVMPKIDMEAIENHLKAAREEERRRRTDREEIRRRLAMGPDYDYYSDRPGRKPSLQARLQSGMNLQICFMNEAVSDTESPSSDTECPLTNPKSKKLNNSNTVNDNSNKNAPVRPATLSIGQQLLQPLTHENNMTETDFFARQARLQTEARMALAQAKQMARMQMEVEKQKQEVSPITEMVRHSLMKVGILFPEEKRRLSRVILTDMNIAQLQVIVNDLHNQIEILNENLVKFLMDRDDLHMEQDSMLVDIEDLTRYLGAKEQVFKEQKTLQPQQNNNVAPPSPAPPSPLAAALNNTVKPHLHRIASLVKK